MKNQKLEAMDWLLVVAFFAIMTAIAFIVIK